MAAPPVLIISPSRATEVLVMLFWMIGVKLTVGALMVRGDAVMLDCTLAPTEFTALTLKVCDPLDRLVNVCDNPPVADIHEPLFSDTSYLIIAAPPLLSGADQFRVT